ncbi:hypothetical protein CUS59_11290 [Enterococcus faecium]|nr:hypothetical protein CUM94_00105 [Enterococcus faecium]PQF83295.1 hypothetical protein CUS59_11290 [Enterococcus faecium]
MAFLFVSLNYTNGVFKLFVTKHLFIKKSRGWLPMLRRVKSAVRMEQNFWFFALINTQRNIN